MPSAKRASLSSWVVLFLAVQVFWAVMAPAGEAAEGKERFPLTLAMSLTPLSSPVIIAEKKGYFTANGLNVTIKDFIGGHRTIKAVFKGEADIATSSEAVVMFNSMKRSDFTIIATFVTSDNDVKIITRKDTGIRNIKDLAGQRIGTITGASAEFFLDQSLLLAGVDSSKVKVIHVDPEDATSALEEKIVDVIVMWEPLIYQIQKNLGDQAVLVLHDKTYNETFNAIVLRSFAASNTAALEMFLRALDQANRFIKANPAESQRIVAQRLNKDIKFIRAIWSDFRFNLSLHQLLITTLETEARWAVASGLVEQKQIPNYLDFIHLGVLDRVRPDGITVIR